MTWFDPDRGGVRVRWLLLIPFLLTLVWTGLRGGIMLANLQNSMSNLQNGMDALTKLQVEQKLQVIDLLKSRDDAIAQNKMIAITNDGRLRVLEIAKVVQEDKTDALAGAITDIRQQIRQHIP